MKIISNGIIPAGMEIMDKVLLEATNNFQKLAIPWSRSDVNCRIRWNKIRGRRINKRVEEICKIINVQA